MLSTYISVDMYYDSDCVDDDKNHKEMEVDPEENSVPAPAGPGPCVCLCHCPVCAQHCNVCTAQDHHIGEEHYAYLKVNLHCTLKS